MIGYSRRPASGSAVIAAATSVTTVRRADEHRWRPEQLTGASIRPPNGLTSSIAAGPASGTKTACVSDALRHLVDGADRRAHGDRGVERERPARRLGLARFRPPKKASSLPDTSCHLIIVTANAGPAASTGARIPGYIAEDDGRHRVSRFR